MNETLPITDLSPRQSEMLAAAADEGGALEIRVAARTRGPAACTQKRAFFSPRDRDVAYEYLEELRGLVERRLLREEGGRNRFELTNAGWELSRKMRR